MKKIGKLLVDVRKFTPSENFMTQSKNDSFDFNINGQFKLLLSKSTVEIIMFLSFEFTFLCSNDCFSDYVSLKLTSANNSTNTE